MFTRGSGRLQTVDMEVGETPDRALRHEGKVALHGGLRGEAVVGIESKGHSVWFHSLTEDWVWI